MPGKTLPPIFRVTWGVVPTALPPTPAFSLPSHSPDPESLPDCPAHISPSQSWLRGSLTMPGGTYRPASNPKAESRPETRTPGSQTLQQSSGYCEPGPGPSPGDRCSWKMHLYSHPHPRAACTRVHPHTDTHTQEQQG